MSCYGYVWNCSLRAAAWLRKLLPSYSRLVYAYNTPHDKGGKRTSAKMVVREVSVMRWLEKGQPLSAMLCVCVFSSLRATYTTIFPFTLVMPSVFTGSGSQSCLAAFPLLLFSTKNQRGCQTPCDQGQPVCHFAAGTGTGSCLKKPRQAAQYRPNSGWALSWFPAQLCSSCVNFPCSKPRGAVPAADCIRQQGLSQLPSPHQTAWTLGSSAPPHPVPSFQESQMSCRSPPGK